MFERDTRRGQVGIGTLIVFIAMVLVAAIAAGVLINTAGVLQSQSELTGEQSSEQVSNRLQEVATIGNVTADGTVDWVNVTVTPAPASGPVSLNNTTITWSGPSGSFQLTRGWDASDLANDVIVLSGEEFGFKPVRDAGGSETVLNDPDDRSTLVISPVTFTDALEGGDEVTLKINTQAGATMTIRVVVPEAPGSGGEVEL
jgi:flagellin-like protein